jgi:hypothetical protein
MDMDNPERHLAKNPGLTGGDGLRK